MAITYQSAGTLNTGTPIRPGVPASVATGDLLILAVGVKAGTATVNTPKSWLALGNLASTTGTSGADTGPTRIYLYAKVYDGVETLGSSIEVTGSWNSPWAQVYRFSNATGFWDISFASGQDTAGGAAWTATMSSTMDITSGDVMLAASVDPTDVSHTYSAAAVTSTGATYGASTIITQPRSSNGQDIGGFIFTQAVTAGSSSDAPVVTATVSATNTNAYGPTALIRIREVTSGGQPTNTATLAGIEVDVASAADGQARLASALTEVAASSTAQARLAGAIVEVMTPRDKTIFANSIGSSEAFGLPAVGDGSGGDQDVTPNAIASGEAIGSPSLQSSNEIQATGIASAEAISSPSLLSEASITATGVASAEAFGSPSVVSGANITATGVPSAEAFGLPSLPSEVTITASGIASVETFGSPSVSTTDEIAANGIASAEVFGSPALSTEATIPANGIASAEALGSPTLSGEGSVIANGISPGEVIGTPSVEASNTVAPQSIGSQESIGSPSVIAVAAIAMTSVGSGEAFGSPTVSAAPTLEIVPDGTASGEQIGQPGVESSATISLTGTSSGEAVGTPALLSLIVVSLTSLTSAEQFGSPSITSTIPDQTIVTVGLNSSEAFGQLVLTLAGVTPDEVMQVLIDAVAADPNSCTVVLSYRSTTAKKATIVESVLDVSPAQQV